MQLKEYVKRVGCVSPRARVFEVTQDMKANGIGTVVVIADDGAAIGIVTDRDVALRLVAERRDPERTCAEEIMSRDISTLPIDASITEATELMRDRGVRRIPIVDGARRVVGIITMDDLLVRFGIELGNLATAIFKGASEEIDRTSPAVPAPSPRP